MIHLNKTLRIAVLTTAFLALAGPAYAQRRGGGPPERDIPPPRNNSQFLFAFWEATADASRSTVRILCDDKEAALGTIIGPDGWILTKYSLLSGKVACRLKDGKTLEARIVGIHEPYDLAMLKVEASDLPPAKFVDSKVAPVGSWVVSVGTGADPVAVGVMSVAARTPPPLPNRGGGPPRPGGNALTTALSLLGATTVGLLAPLHNAGSLLVASALVTRRPPGPPYLGISVAQEGTAVKITSVAPRSAASRAGLLVDDLILSIQGTPIPDQDALAALLATLKVGDSITIKLVRQGKEMELKATLEQRGPGPPGRPDQNLMGSELSGRRTGFPTYFQSDTVIRPKDCGGPICDLEGRVLGINIARAGRVESYSIPTEAILPLLGDLMSGKLSPKYLAIAALEKKIADLKAAVKKAEEDKAAIDNKVKEAQDALKKHEAEQAAAEKKLKEARDALARAEKELKEKQ
jgi:serine protease Do